MVQSQTDGQNLMHKQTVHRHSWAQKDFRDLDYKIIPVNEVNMLAFIAPCPWQHRIYTIDVI